MMTKIIDADGHIVEPRALWDEYVEPAYRDRIPRIAKDSEGIDRLKFEGRVAENSVYAPAAMCIPGGLSRPELMRTLSWDDLRPGSYDPRARLRDMDQEGIDISFLFPSLGMGFTAIRDAQLSAAACRAYNNWMADFCAADPKRLFSIAPLPLGDINAAISEMRRVVTNQGVKAIMVRPNPCNNRRLSDPAYDRFWNEAQELDCSIAVHSAVTGDLPTAGFDRYHDFFQRMIISHPLEQQMACMDLICGGVLDRFPRLRFAFMEAGGGWLPYWLARMDEFYEKIGHLAPGAKIKPSEYFARQCFCTCEPDDVALKVADTLGANKFLMWASDYPHYDCKFPGAVEELREHCGALAENSRRQIMGDNAARFYHLN
jgi:predicted TIM-barrel fold metal-dependent hydrolase